MKASKVPKGEEYSLDELIEKELKALIRLVESANITELEVEWGDTKVRIKKAYPQPSGDVGVEEEANVGREGVPQGRLKLVRATLVGTFSTAADDGAPALVEVGSRVEAGDVVGFIEAMNVKTEVLSDFSGRVVRVLVENGESVEYGQPLLEVETAEES